MVKLIIPTPSRNFVRGWSTAGAGHRGIDYGWQTANPAETQKILAAAAGKVIEVYSGNGYNGGWGRRIRIDHGHGNVTTYNHIRPGGVLVSVGQSVNAGDLIGLMGSSGASTGTHLHLELYVNGVRVDPAPYFSKDLPGTGNEGSTGGGSNVPGGATFSVPAGGQYYYWKLENALIGNYASNQLLRGGQTLEVVQNSNQGPVQVRAADGDLVWVGTRNHPAAINGSAPAPSTKTYFDVPGEGQFFYNDLNNAVAGRYSRNQLIPGNAGALEVVRNSGRGPVLVNWNGRQVWVGTKNHPAQTRQG